MVPVAPPVDKDKPTLKGRYLFGLVDGINGAVGLTIGLLRLHASASIVFVALLSRAGASAISMAGAQYESDESESTKEDRFRTVAAMGIGYVTSALLPGLGFAVGLRPGIIVFVPTTIIILFFITKFRAKRKGWIKATETTMLIFSCSVAAGLLASLVGG